MDVEIEDGVDVNSEEENPSVEWDAGEGSESVKKRKKNKNLGPLFDSTTRYDWKLCGGRSKQNYIPCIDMEGAGGRRHHERSCPADGDLLGTYTKGVWNAGAMARANSRLAAMVLYGNVAHPKLSAFIKTNKFINVSGEYLRFPPEESDFKGGVQHYLDSIEEMVPDIEWGKNIRILLNIGCSDASFVVSLLEKNVITLSLGLMSDQRDLTQVLLERGIPSVMGNLGTRRLPFPAGVFDAVHCSSCNIHWHSNGGRLLLEINRILRPGVTLSFQWHMEMLKVKRMVEEMLKTVRTVGEVSSQRDWLKELLWVLGCRIGWAPTRSSSTVAGMSLLTASICWNVLAHKTDDTSDLDIMIYQRPISNDIYNLRRRNEPPFCKDDENQDFAWYVPIKGCLHKLPTALEERGTDWPEEWPSRLETFPEWLGDAREKIIADNEHWNAIIKKSYLVGMGIDWSNVRNVMDMKAIYGGFAAGLVSQKVWVMNVVPVHAPNTLPIIYERGLVGIYHDWCEPFSTHPRSYDLLHADHLFSCLKNRCKQPIVIVVEMDRILRPGGWVIIRDKSLILNPLEKIFKTMHWDVKLTFHQDREGIICLKKTMWRPSA
ncbi:hypothetical protein HPP92_017681 [Vanilla planifolia]|uniref:Methyltransferase n=1 Tax=Vanilla planifolia TaxID=51239 RepID=A0A835Q4E9_VANPL|nr:hypothetical protein HPP92_017681 [Vanilla planifolia]